MSYVPNNLSAKDLDLYGVATIGNHEAAELEITITCDRDQDQFLLGVPGLQGTTTGIPVSLLDLRNIGLLCLAVAENPTPITIDPEGDSAA